MKISRRQLRRLISETILKEGTVEDYHDEFYSNKRSHDTLYLGDGVDKPSLVTHVGGGEPPDFIESPAAHRRKLFHIIDDYLDKPSAHHAEGIGGAREAYEWSPGGTTVPDAWHIRYDFKEGDDLDAEEAAAAFIKKYAEPCKLANAGARNFGFKSIGTLEFTPVAIPGYLYGNYYYIAVKVIGAGPSPYKLRTFIDIDRLGIYNNMD